MAEDSKERTYEPAEIEERLKRELPHWRYENGWIRRTFRTSSWKGTLMVINAVGHLAEPGQCPHPHESLAHLAECGVHRVFLRPGPEYLGGYRQGLLVDLYRRLCHGHSAHPSLSWIPRIPGVDICGIAKAPSPRSHVRAA